MTELNYHKLSEIIDARMQSQLENPLNELGTSHTTQELLGFAIEEAWQNNELDFLCEIAYYQCKDEDCKDPEFTRGDMHQRTTQTRDAETLQEAGDPYCQMCGGDMEAISAEHYQTLNK